MKLYVVGCGGGGSFDAPLFCKLIGKENVTLIDGDKLEAKNLDRQLFNPNQIGLNKAEALASLYGCDFMPEWYSASLMEHEPSDVLLGEVDNHPARLSILNACDMHGCSAIFGANETYSAEAYLYLPEWRGGPNDPRTYYPEISTVTTGDPRAHSIGCTGESQKANRQLVSANFISSALVVKLFVMHFMVGRITQEVRKSLPFHLISNLSKFEEHKPQ